MGSHSTLRCVKLLSPSQLSPAVYGQSLELVGFSGGFTPCRHLRPSSGRERRVLQLIQSSDVDDLMNETRRKPTTRARCPTLSDKWHGIFYMPSHTDTAGHTKAFIYTVTQTRLDIPRPLFTQSHRHGWAYQGL